MKRQKTKQIFYTDTNWPTVATL